MPCSPSFAPSAAGRSGPCRRRAAPPGRRSQHPAHPREPEPIRDPQARPRCSRIHPPHHGHRFGRSCNRAEGMAGRLDPPRPAGLPGPLRGPPAKLLEQGAPRRGGGGRVCGGAAAADERIRGGGAEPAARPGRSSPAGVSRRCERNVAGVAWVRDRGVVGGTAAPHPEERMRRGTSSPVFDDRREGPSLRSG